MFHLGPRMRVHSMGKEWADGCSQPLQRLRMVRYSSTPKQNRFRNAAGLLKAYSPGRRGCVGTILSECSPYRVIVTGTSPSARLDVASVDPALDGHQEP